VKLLGFKEWLKEPYCVIPLVAVVFASILFFFRAYMITDFLIIAVVGYLGSDVVSKLFVRGKRGILQIPILGNKAQPKGYGFIAFFLSIVITALLMNVITNVVISAISVYFSDFIADMGLGLALAALVYSGMYAKFYVH
jgi:hypothetical protein